ncbi:MAG: Histidinol-phosphate aminotransferase [Candidatus Roizmanbacteria bacterium GW2011_GWC2_37_13]|uniref:Histidinol-phosphate aminotransferase n=1 Tax=Candidatus Roizmanbacteria bacterium GW2011_GWC2_37_13 TaxID=1618486 RepID=A0A0G0G541_9BACT|nr:MAG: Histidinol-phosphate aminotransferase [Candidatus Roizmanbacteria bacterium GW2011_GWC1_37_12]KKQ25142.1 MAG: Histidinol-phosphate aminotransferase [Candidatus Roizmanbacteria bacterium GW2011_GWC2_37_13]
MKNNLGNYTHQVENPDKFTRFDLTEGNCWFEEKISEWFREIKITDTIHYPDEKIISVKKLLSRWLHVKQDNIAIGNGSDELIEMIPNIFINKRSTVLTVAPSFFRFIESSERAGAEIVTVKLDKDSRFEWGNLTIKNFLKKAKDKKIKLIWLTSPNNPTGTEVPKQILLEIIKLGKIVVIDKVLNGFTKELREISQLIWDNPNLIVLSSFSKTFGLPGLRFGFAISSHDKIDLLEKRRLPFNVAGPSLFVVKKLLQSLLAGEIKMEGALTFFQERIFLEKEIQKLKNIKLASNSKTNFVLLQPVGRLNLFKKLVEKNILVTDLNQTIGIKNKNFVRVTLRDRQNNQILLKILKEIDNHFH